MPTANGGWQRSKKATVEDGLWLSVTTFVKKKGTVGAWSQGTLSWSYEECEPHSPLRFEQLRLSRSIGSTSH